MNLLKIQFVLPATKQFCINILFDKAAKSIIFQSPSLHLHNASGYPVF